MSRISSHRVEERAVQAVASFIANYDGTDAMFRELTGRDYGIDAIIELFEGDYPTGKIALIQIKGRSEKIMPMEKTPSKISCQITSSNACYALQNNIPVILVFVSIKAKEVIYFADIREILDGRTKKKVISQKSITVHIPTKNNTLDDPEKLFEIIKKYYEKEK